jgi:hypothetical protein
LFAAHDYSSSADRLAILVWLVPSIAMGCPFVSYFYVAVCQVGSTHVMKLVLQAALGHGVDSDSDPVLEWAEYLVSSIAGYTMITRCMESLSGTDPASHHTSEQCVLAELLVSACGFDRDGAPITEPDTAHLLLQLDVPILLDLMHSYGVLSKPLVAASTPEHEQIHRRLILDAKRGLLLLFATGILQLRADLVWDKALESYIAEQLLPQVIQDVAGVDKLSSTAHCPVGFKSTAVRFIANAASHGATVFKDGVLACDGVGVVLNQCKVDPHNPMLREWALLAVKHMTEDHVGIQEYISSMQAITVAQTPELAALGVKADLTPEGKVQIRKKVASDGGGVEGK